MRPQVTSTHCGGGDSTTASSTNPRSQGYVHPRSLGYVQGKCYEKKMGPKSFQKSLDLDVAEGDNQMVLGYSPVTQALNIVHKLCFIFIVHKLCGFFKH